MYIINYMSYSWMLSSMPHSLIGRTWRQLNYPNKLAPKRGSQRSLMSTPTTPGEIIGQCLYCSSLRPGYSHMSDMNMIQSIMNRYLCKTRKMAKGELATKDLIIPTPKLPYVIFNKQLTAWSITFENIWFYIRVFMRYIFCFYRRNLLNEFHCLVSSKITTVDDFTSMCFRVPH